LKPARSWENRAFAGGIARYDADLRQWSQIGGNFTISYKDAKLMDGKSTSIQKPFAFSPGYSVHLPTLAFDVDNGMHVFWSWRKEGAGMETTHPSYAYSPDRENFSLRMARNCYCPFQFQKSNHLLIMMTGNFMHQKL
jgi:hypothetical protein